MLGADSPVSGSESSWDESDDQSDNSSLVGGFAEPYRNIRTILNQLARISLAIQKSGAKHRFKRVDTLLDEALYAPFKSHLSFLILIKFDTTSQSSDYEKLSKVQKRLVHANIVRRNRIKQLTKPSPSAGISQRQTEDRRDPITSVNEALLATTLPTQNVQQQAAVPLDPNPVPQSQSEAKPTHSRATDQAISRATSTPGSGLTTNIQAILSKMTRSVATKATHIGASVEYPRCPHGKTDEDFECPYCNSILPSQYREKASWM